ncbi:MAG: HaeII family restriction endonuclease, partial [Acidobacteria bacterium]|nr:HaeII family restriction endonuclease [Acidobacteriota bacterium]
MPTTKEAKTKLDLIIGKSRVDLYKPIHIAEVLYRSRAVGDFDIAKLETFQNPSLRWRNEITNKLAGKVSTSSARYQHDVWNITAMPTEILTILDAENKATGGAVEKYIYSRYGERQGTVSSVISAIKKAAPKTFKLETLLELFVKESGIKRSIDKAYEIVVYSLFETIISAFGAKVKVSVSEDSKPILEEFSDLAKVLLGVDENKLFWEQTAHIFRVGVTNAADRGLDMWGNFGVVVQVKHLTLNEKLAGNIAAQVE